MIRRALLLVVPLSTCLSSRDGQSDGQTSRVGDEVVPASALDGEDEIEIDEDEAINLTAPRPKAIAPTPELKPFADHQRTALAFQFNAPVYARPDGSDIMGIVRRGERVPIARWVPGSGCPEGSWYELVGGGYICNREGFNTSRGATELPAEIQTAPADLDAPLPFEYAKIDGEGTPLYWRRPTAQEEAAAAANPGGEPAPIKLRVRGDVFVAIHRVEQRDDGVRFARTLRGLYVRDDRLKRKPAPSMIGEALAGPDDLPLAFVWVDETTILDEDGEPRGVAQKFARFPIEREVSREGVAYVSSEYGLVRREDVRIARVVTPHDKIPADAQWVHVDLGEQVLVAYEGRTPVRATLISSGKAGHEPPFGAFQVVKKFATKTMAGDDPVDGYYEVDQVPWIQYYWGSLALHGAYWHDGFGQVRSHGCTNIPPADAQWLYWWSKPDVPPHWHGRVGIDGLWVFNTP